MAEVILPPEESEPELPEEQLPEVDKPTDLSKVITVKFNPLDTGMTSTANTRQSFYTTDTDAWIVFEIENMGAPNGEYSLVLYNKSDGSIFQRTGDIVSGAAYYKIEEEEIKHAGDWVGQVVITLVNGKTTTSRFSFNVAGHLLDGKDVRQIVIQDFETLMKQLNGLKDDAEIDFRTLKNDIEESNRIAKQNEIKRQEAEKTREESYKEKVDAAIVEADVVTKVDDKVAELSPTIQNVTAQLAQKIDEVIYDIPAQTVKFYANDSFISEIDITEASNASLVQNYIDSLVSNGDIAGVTLGDKVVTPEKTSFFEMTTNLFNPNNLIHGQYLGAPNIDNSSGIYLDSAYSMTNYSIKVTEGEVYTRKHIHRAVFKDSFGNFIGRTPDITGSVENQIDTFSVPKNATSMYLSVMNKFSFYPDSVQINKGSELLPYEPYHEDPKRKIPVKLEELSFIEKNEDNLFDGNYKTGTVYSTGSVVSYVSEPNGNGKVALVKVDKETTYTVTKYNPSNRFRVALIDSPIPSWQDGKLNVEKSIISNDTESSVTFMTTNKTEYIVVGVSNQSEEPRLKVSLGSTITPFETYSIAGNKIAQKPKSIDTSALKDGQKLDLIELSDIQKLRKPDFHIIDVFEGLYNAPNEEQFPDLAEIETINNYEIIYNMMDELVTDFPDFLTMTVIGYDSLGNEIRAYDSNLPYLKRGTGEVISSRLPYEKKIAITGGVHGNEKKSVTSLVRVIREIFYNPRNDINLDILKWNISFTVVPIVSPDCYNRNSRLNSNGVNLNRNFDASFVVTSESGSTPASEPETKAIQNWMDNWENVYYYIDYHTITGDRPMGYAYDRDSATLLNSLIRSLTYKWKKDYPDVNTVYDLYGYITTEITNGDTSLYARNLGVSGITFEFADNSILFGDSKNDIINRRSSMEFLGNLLILLAKGR